MNPRAAFALLLLVNGLLWLLTLPYRLVTGKPFEGIGGAE